MSVYKVLLAYFIITFLVASVTAWVVGRYLFLCNQSWRCFFGFHDKSGHYYQTHGMTLNPNDRGVTGHTSCVKHCSRCGIRTYIQGEEK